MKENYDDLLKSINKEVELTRSIVLKKETLQRELFEFKSQYDNSIANLEELKSKKQNSEENLLQIESDLDALYNEAHTIEELLPNLEKEKRESVKKKNFKEANEKSKTIKIKTTRQEEIKVEIENLNKDKEELSGSFGSQFKINEEKLEKEMSQCQKEYFLGLHRMLELNVTEVNRIIYSVELYNGNE